MNTKLTEVAKNIISGIALVLILTPSSGYIRPTKGGFSKDAQNLQNDFGQIASGLNTSYNQYKRNNG